MALDQRIVAEEGNVTTAYPDSRSPLAQACRRAGIDPVHAYMRLPNWQAYSGAPWTIGNGHTGPEVHPGLEWTQAQIDAARAADIAEARAEVRAALAWTAQLDAVRRDVLADMAFNIGIAKLEGFTQTLRLIQLGRYTDAAAEMQRSDWADEVPARAATLSRIMRTGHDE
jgi:lysozyme